MVFWLMIIAIANKIVEVVIAAKIIKVIIATKIMIGLFINLAMTILRTGLPLHC
jgi:hypothetical protein